MLDLRLRGVLDPGLDVRLDFGLVGALDVRLVLSGDVGLELGAGPFPGTCGEGLCSGRVGGAHRRVVSPLELGNLGRSVVEPVRGPDPVEAPAQPLQVLAPEPVPVTHAARTPVGGAVGFDGQDHPVGIVGVGRGEVDPVSAYARELLEERGIRAGYLATGMARWDELFLSPAAPVLLRGLTITPTTE
jgi:hypothetical protein